MRIWLGLALGALLCAPAPAQDASQPRPEIYGTVLEYPSRSPIAGAPVELLFEQQTQPLLSTKTDSKGAFEFHPDAVGRYTVRIQAQGYKSLGNTFAAALFLRASGGDFARSRSSTIESQSILTAGRPKQELNFVLARPTELRGQVVDEETGEPLAKIPVNWVTPAVASKTFLSGPQVYTDGDGQFVFPSVLPGEYAIQIHPRLLGAAQIVTKFSEDDLETIDQDFETTFWPGGREFNPSAVFNTSPGSSLNTGVVKVRKTDYYRVQVALTAANCPDGDFVHVRLEDASSVPNQRPTPELDQVPCASSFLIRGIAPGSYVLNLTHSLIPQTRAVASLPFSIRDRNIQLAASLNRGVDIRGRIVLVDGVTPPSFDQLTINLEPIEGVSFISPRFSPGNDGEFRLVNLPQGRELVSLQSNRAGYYLREVRYNGRPEPETIFTVDPGASQQLLELVLDNKPGAIAGVVEENDNPVSKPYVVAAKWPYSGETVELHRSFGGADGKFRLPALSPGEYRVLAVSDANKDKLIDPAVLERLLPYAEKVTLGRGATQDVHLKLVDPDR